MAGIALLMPSPDLYEQARKFYDKTDYHITTIEETTFQNVVSKAREAIDAGSNIIISRGRQAYEIRQYTNVPVVEMVITAQEMGLLIVKAKQFTKNPHPLIGVIAWKEMLCDMTYFSELYDADILFYSQDETTKIQDSVIDAYNHHVDVIIGGKTSLIYAEQYNIPALEISSTGESIHIAVRTAENMYQMLEEEQHNYAIFSTILDSSFNGIFKIDNNGFILAANRIIRQITGHYPNELIGVSIYDVLTGLDKQAISEVLKERNNPYYTFLNVNNQPSAIVIEGIFVNDEPRGAIISCNPVQRQELKSEKNLREQYLHGYTAKETLESIEQLHPSFHSLIQLARAFARSDSPILIEQASGPEAESLCEGIHNYSLRRRGPFILVNLAGIDVEDQYRLLFGGLEMEGVSKSPGALLKAQFGTLVLMGADKLTKQSQYYLTSIMQKKIIKNYVFAGNEIKSQLLDIRFIFCSSKNMVKLIQQDKIRKDFYYKIKALSLCIPTLNEREKDREVLLDFYMEKYIRQYSHYHVLTSGARNLLVHYQWDCGEIQMESFIDRLILTVGKRTIREEHVQALLEELYPENEIARPYANPLVGEENKTELKERDKIAQCLSHYGNSKTLTAKALGISKSTLWRKIKKYGL